MLSRTPLIVCAPCLALALVLLLGACQKGADQLAAKAAGAKVLPSSISDAMLDLDQSHAQPLLQPYSPAQEPAADHTGDSAAEAVDATEPAAPAAAVKPAVTTN